MNFFLISLGCPKNLTDSEDFCARLMAKGHKMVFNPQEADTVIVNTCAFLSSSVKEAEDNIRYAIDLKKKGIVKTVAVTGCMVERLKEKVQKEFPEADCIFSVAEQEEIENIIDRKGSFLKPIQTVLPVTQYKISLTMPHSAYLKVADGCNNRCSYCAIPFIRGVYRSKPIEEIVKEAKVMVKSGVKEFSLIAQDTTSYGQDLYGQPQLVALLKELLKIKTLPRMRIMYAYPHRVTKELALLMASTDRIYHYLDIPLQHISENILKTMNRHSSAAQTKEVLAMLRKTVPDIAIRTNFIVGFPGETDKDFKELLNFVKDFKFDNVGVFEYSREKGTSAWAMENQIPAKIKRERSAALNEEQSRVIDEINKNLIGKEIEMISDGGKFGRTYKDAPDIDGRVTFEKSVKAGRIFKAVITGAKGYERTAR